MTAVAEDSHDEDVPMARSLSETSPLRQVIAPQGLTVNTGPIERDIPLAITFPDT